MSVWAAPMSPKHGYDFDGQEHDVRRARKDRPCQGGRGGRGDSHHRSPNCTETIRKGDTYCATVDDMATAYGTETFACIPCALSVEAVKEAT